MSNKIKVFGAVLSLFITNNAHAYSPTFLTPSWFKVVANSYSSNNKPIWRGQVLKVNSPTQLLLKNEKDELITLNLLHIGLSDKASTKQYSTAISALSALVGNYVYVLGDDDKENINGILIDGSGKDLNIILVSQGIFDVNQTSLMFEPRKDMYRNALQVAKQYKAGIWKN